MEGVFFEGACGRVFYEATRDALNPISPSYSMGPQAVINYWGQSTYNATLNYAAGRVSYLSGKGLIYSLKSSVYRAGMQAASMRMVAAPIAGGMVAVYEGLFAEVAALRAGEGR